MKPTDFSNSAQIAYNKRMMTPRFRFSFFAAAIALAPAHAQMPAPQTGTPAGAAANRTVTRPVASGVTLTQQIVGGGAPDGPLVITLLRVDPKAAGVQIEAALGQDKVWGNDPTMGRESVSAMVSRHKAIAGVNAGFFPFMGNPLGLHIQNGEIVTEPIKNRTVFYVDRKGVAHIRAFGFSGSVRNTITGETLPLSGLNRKASVVGDALLLYTPLFQDKTLRDAKRTETILPTGKKPLTGDRDFVGLPTPAANGGQTPLQSGTMVLSGAGAGADFIKRAADAKQMLSVRLNVIPLPNADETVAPPVQVADIQSAVTGAPRLLTNGKITIRLKEESMGVEFSTTRHPRTAACIAKNGDVLLVTVDGRQRISRGVSLPEFADLLLKVGAVDAVNLDGGGSTVAVVRGMVINSPSSGAERPIADAILVSAKNLPSPKKLRFVLPAAQATGAITLATGETRRFAPTETAEGIWGTQGGVGFVYQDGNYLAQRPGKGVVSFAAPDGKTHFSIPVTVVGAGIGDAAGFTAKLALVPEVSGGTNPLRTTLSIHIANAEGDPLSNEPVALTVTGGKPDAPTVSTDAKGNAQIGITWDATPIKEKSVLVSSPAKRFNNAQIVLPALVPGS